MFLCRLLNYIEEGGGSVGCPLPDEDMDETVDLDSLNKRVESMTLQGMELYSWLV